MLEARENSAPLVVMTIGHSTHPIAEFIELLRSHRVARLVDVRTVPRSRHNPQFNRDALAQSLEAAQIGYSYMPGLGGFRRAKRDSAGAIPQVSTFGAGPGAPENVATPVALNAGWRNASFRGYADYMQTEEFERNLEELIALAATEKVAIMCAEAVPWRCHRSLIADALTVRGIEVREITGAHSEKLHRLTTFARVDGTRISYPAQSTPS
jgi:uncharacterized protein (DUF488 family)